MSTLGWIFTITGAWLMASLIVIAFFSVLPDDEPYPGPHPRHGEHRRKW